MTMYPVLLNNRPAPVSSRRISRLPVVLAASCALAFTLGVTGALANSQTGGYTNMGGYTGPGPAVSTVEQAKAMRDDTHLALRGRIVQHLGGKHYLFRDDTGTIEVEIENKRWQGQSVGPDDVVEIYGEVDKEWNELAIDVDRIVKK